MHAQHTLMHAHTRTHTHTHLQKCTHTHFSKSQFTNFRYLIKNYYSKVLIVFPCSQKQLEQSESRASAQRGELSTVREACQQGEVERQLLEGEKAQMSEALTRVQILLFLSCY